MATQAVSSITCPNCRTPFTAPIQQIIDVQTEPDAKSRLLSGQLNTVICPHCGFQGALNVPFLYHDAALELALVYIPMELGSTDVERQKSIGDLTNRLMQQLPPEARKGYLFQPRTFFSVENLIDALLEQDEETREQLEMQQRKMDLIEQLRQIDPEDSLAVAEFIGANDEEVDTLFFQLLEVLIGIAEARGDTSEQERLAQHQTNLMEKSRTGRLFKAQQDAVEALTANPTRETLIGQLITAEEKEVRKALVAVGRQMLDYAFFQSLTSRIEAAESSGDGTTADKLINLRKEIQEIRDQVDAVAMAVLDARAILIRELLIAENRQETLMRRILEIDNAFFSVLSTNIRAAESAGRQEMVQQLHEIGDMAVAALNEFAPPEVMLINQLASADNDEQVRQLLEDKRELLNQEFLQLVEGAMEGLQESGRQESADRLRYAAQQVKAMIAV